MLTHAFKEWAAVCNALAGGSQSLILRKGGIAESDDPFELEHTRFWLYPTFTHQQKSALKPSAIPLLESAETDKPPAGKIRLSHFAEATGIYRVRDLIPLLMLNHLHIWSEETVRKRFAYRYPGLCVLPVRVYKIPAVMEIRESPAYAGCRTWVTLDRPISTEGAVPVLADSAYRDLERALAMILNPIAYA